MTSKGFLVFHFLNSKMTKSPLIEKNPKLIVMIFYVFSLWFLFLFFFLIITWAKGWFDNLANLNIIKKMVVVCITHISVWVCSWVSSGVYTFADWPNTRFQGSIGKCPASPPCLSGMCEQRTTGLSLMTYSSFVFLFPPLSLPWFPCLSTWFFFEFSPYSFN